ncbi:hypothetical protein L1987_47963 [Smallanthus sonchifolius]|uniref:Uncharacterized protein n=1 Tax=Smallanthus sonchifolius TaxID=185202 RepID=A0ACB9FQM6_9ASTR|nr:hypothetical protein L1987_47963 [Smallanthus sonchifolius]
MTAPPLAPHTYGLTTSKGYLSTYEAILNDQGLLWRSKDTRERFRRMDLQISEKRKRGASTCKKKLSFSNQSGIKFNANGIAIGEKSADFMSWVGAEFKNKIPINKVAKDVDSKLYDCIWEYAKETWKIPDDHAKHTTLRKEKSVEKCDLLWSYDPPTPLVLGKGLVHFTTERTLHGRPMKDGFVKVQVDRVEEGCTQMPLLLESCTPGEVNYMSEAKGKFIQWSRKSIKFGATSDKQTMPNEIDAYRRYSYALRDDEGFYELLADDHFSHNGTEPV